jgi:hypothetical protein
MKKTVKVTLHITAILERTITAEVSEKVIREYMKDYDGNDLRFQVCTMDKTIDSEWSNPDSLELQHIQIEDKHKLFGDGFNETNYCWLTGDTIK